MLFTANAHPVPHPQCGLSWRACSVSNAEGRVIAAGRRRACVQEFWGAACCDARTPTAGGAMALESSRGVARLPLAAGGAE
eukprot:6176225-Pleurochrysis_carterae.AAC.3